MIDLLLSNVLESRLNRQNLVMLDKEVRSVILTRIYSPHQSAPTSMPVYAAIVSPLE